MYTYLYTCYRLDPMILHKPISGIQQTCITFAQETQVRVHAPTRIINNHNHHDVYNVYLSL